MNKFVLINMIILFGLVAFSLLSVIFENNGWFIMFFWINAAIVVFCVLIMVYEHFFWTKKIKDIRNKHVVVSVF